MRVGACTSASTVGAEGPRLERLLSCAIAVVLTLRDVDRASCARSQRVQRSRLLANFAALLHRYGQLKEVRTDTATRFSRHPSCDLMLAHNVMFALPSLPALFVLTMKRQIKHMIKYRYVPFSLGKARCVAV